MMLKNDFD